MPSIKLGHFFKHLNCAKIILTKFLTLSCNIHLNKFLNLIRLGISASKGQLCICFH